MSQQQSNRQNGPQGAEESSQNSQNSQNVQGGHDEEDMTEMLNELRILLPGSQLLTGFLITLPFNSGFKQILEFEKWIFLATFLCSLSSLVLFTAPAVQHRMLRPLMDRVRFKDIASKQMLAGAVILSVALVLSALLVVSELAGYALGSVVAATITALVVALWWVYPWWLRRRLRMTGSLAD